jgi:MFS family permease
MDSADKKAVAVTDAPARLDALPWGRFHWLVVLALGVAWVLDGLEVTLVGALAGALGDRRTLGLSPQEIGWAGSAYVAGAVAGALFFGRLTDSLGRRRLFTATVVFYLLSTLATGFSWNFASFAAFRALTGAGVGGEYAAVNSAIQELIPARFRGRTDLAVNGSFWVGAAIGALGATVLLDPRLLPVEAGWRLAFVGGALLGVVIVYVRRFIPESPRWLMTHGKVAEAERIVEAIEASSGVRRRGDVPRIALAAHRPIGVGAVIRTLIIRYPKRTALGLILMATQAFCYNAIFFTYGLVLMRFFGVPSQRIGWFLLPFAAGNFVGPLALGPLFDTVGRKPMIAATYAIAGSLLIGAGWLFSKGALTATGLTAAWTVIFFFASAAASAAYLTVGECFPLETRALVIALFYAVGTGAGGIAGPALFGEQIASGSPALVFHGYLLGGALMLAAALAEMALGVPAERRPLEEIAPPLSQADA